MSKIAAISTVKAPASELKTFVNHHLRISIDEIILFFDDPGDKAVELFENNRQVHCKLCTDDYWNEKQKHKPDSIEERQIINVNHGVKIAKSKGCDWIIHIDSDELIYNASNQPIVKILEKSNADIVRLAVREAIADHYHCDSVFQAKWFKKPVTTKKIKKAIKFGCQNVIFRDEFFRGHLESKAFVRVGPGIYQYGIHYPLDYANTIVVKWIEEIRLLHFDCIGFDTWKSKWSRRLDGSATAKKMRKNRRIQFQEFERARVREIEVLRPRVTD